MNYDDQLISLGASLAVTYKPGRCVALPCPGSHICCVSIPPVLYCATECHPCVRPILYHCPNPLSSCPSDPVPPVKKRVQSCISRNWATISIHFHIKHTHISMMYLSRRAKVPQSLAITYSPARVLCNASSFPEAFVFTIEYKDWK